MSGSETTRRHEVVRPFVMTGGRTRAERRDLRVETMLQSTVEHVPRGLPSEQEELVALCIEPQSVAEVAAKLGLVVGVVQVIAGVLARFPRSPEYTARMFAEWEAQEATAKVAVPAAAE